MKPLSQWSSADIIGIVKGVDKKTWVTILVGGVVSLVLLVFLVIPAWIERPLLRQKMKTMEAQIRQVNALSQKRRVWEENQKIFGSLISETQSRVFTPAEMGLLLGHISKMASESHVDVMASKPLEEKNAFAAPYHLKYQPSGYEFTVQGGYHDLGALASRIEGDEKLLRIRSIEISPLDKDSSRQVAQLKLWAILAATPPSPVSASGAGVNRGKK